MQFIHFFIFGSMFSISSFCKISNQSLIFFKAFFLLISFAFVTFSLKAQIGIGTLTPDSSARPLQDTMEVQRLGYIWLLEDIASNRFRKLGYW